MSEKTKTKEELKVELTYRIASYGVCAGILFVLPMILFINTNEPIGSAILSSLTIGLVYGFWMNAIWFMIKPIDVIGEKLHNICMGLLHTSFSLMLTIYLAFGGFLLLMVAVSAWLVLALPYALVVIVGLIICIVKYVKA